MGFPPIFTLSRLITLRAFFFLSRSAAETRVIAFQWTERYTCSNQIRNWLFSHDQLMPTILQNFHLPGVTKYKFALLVCCAREFHSQISWVMRNVHMVAPNKFNAQLPLWFLPYVSLDHIFTVCFYQTSNTSKYIIATRGSGAKLLLFIHLALFHSRPRRVTWCWICRRINLSSTIWLPSRSHINDAVCRTQSYQQSQILSLFITW